MHTSQINIFRKIRVPLADSEIKRIVAVVFASEKIKSGEINILFVDDRTIKKLNRRFRCTNRATDVLSFPNLAPTTKKNLKGFLGDVAISAERAKKIAPRYGNSSRKELALYLVHGVLHLIGYGDEHARNKAKMVKRQEKILKELCKTRAL